MLQSSRPTEFSKDSIRDRTTLFPRLLPLKKRKSPANEVVDRSVSMKKTDMWRNLFAMRFKPIQGLPKKGTEDNSIHFIGFKPRIFFALKCICKTYI